MIPVPILRWALVGVAFGLSGWFLGSSIYPVLASVSNCPSIWRNLINKLQAEAKATRLIIVLLAMIHVGIAISFQVLFFSYYIVKIGPDASLPGSLPGGGDAGNSTVARWI